MRHRLGTRGQLLSGWHDNRIGHDVSRWQLLRRRGNKRRYVLGERHNKAVKPRLLNHFEW
jgi:hypothetical protein